MFGNVTALEGLHVMLQACGLVSPLETLMIYKLSSIKFTTQNDLYW